MGFPEDMTQKMISEIPSEKAGVTNDDYYENFDSFFDLQMMGERIEHVGLPEDVAERLRSSERNDFLVLGSATVKNINEVTRIAHHIHGKKQVVNDVITIVDLNDTSIRMHKEAVEQLDRKSDWTGTTVRESSAEAFPYPRFNVERGDIRNLPYGDSTKDVVISDYTINFLDTPEDINGCFGEVARVLKEDGVLFIAFRYKKDDDAPIERASQGGVIISKMRLEDYLASATRSGLTILKKETIYTEGAAGDIMVVFGKDPDKRSRT
ncbi:MAG: class I SAM-dependent methyltransferase [Candidatus Moranbacteria bacterium]|nr:class I SAM-dependent methyltransferase [Candidatus Moranbacteria bacterium]